MTDTTRDLIQRLARELDAETGYTIHSTGERVAHPDVVEARAYLAQPEPEGPTDEELLAILSQAVASFPPIHPEAEALSAVEYDWEMEARKARAVIAADRARWGRTAVGPVPASEMLWEREGWCDAKGQCWMGDGGGNGFVPSWRLCKPSDCRLRWSLPHYALPTPQP